MLFKSKKVIVGNDSTVLDYEGFTHHEFHMKSAPIPRPNKKLCNMRMTPVVQPNI